MGAHTEDDCEDRGANVSAAHLSWPFAALGKSNQGRSVARGPRYEALGARGRFRGLVFDRASAEWWCRLGRGAAVGWPTWRMFARMAVALFGTLAWAAESVHTVPYVPSAASVGHAGLVRIESRSGVSGEVSVVAVDDAGQRVEAGLLTLGAMAVIEFEAGALESGDASLGLTGTGPGEGDWRLELTTDLDIEARAYARSEGFLTALHDAVLLSGEVELPFFNPGGAARRSVLRLANACGEPAAVSVRGVDDVGRAAGPVTAELGPWEARSYAASELESGSAAGLTGSLGDGAGRWRLTLSADRGSAYATNLLLDGSGVLSSVPGGMSRGGFHRVPLFPPASDGEGRRGLVRAVNRSADSAEVGIDAFDATDRAYERLELTLAGEASGQFDSSDLERGNAEKGLTGSTGPGGGDWWLELTSESDIEVLSYVDTASGPLSALRGTAGVETDTGMRYEALLWGESGEVRLLNAGGAPAEVRLTGVDDAGSSGGAVELTLAPRSARTLTATALAEGEAGLRGALGAVSGSWRLRLEADRELDVLSLVRGSGGMLSDVSRRGRPAGAPPRTEVIDATARGRPDLWASASASEAELSPGEAFELTATVGNRGGSGAPPTTLRYHRSADASITTGDAELGVDAVAALAAGATSAESLTLNAPTAPGTHYYGACADAVAEETNTANNCSAAVAVKVTEPPRRPDLAVATMPSEAALEPGESFTLTATVRNVGDSASAATFLRYYRSTDATISGADTEVGTDAVDALSASGTSAESITLTAPSTAGTYYYGACADAVADETETANNCSAAVAVTVTEPPRRPDLAVAATLSDAALEPGESFTLTATVRNRGGAQAQATTLRYYRSTDAMIARSDETVGTDSVAALGALAASAESVELTAPAEMGTYYYGACADAVPEETNASNNCSGAVAVTVTERSRRPDLAVVVAGPDEAVAPGGSFELRATVRNAGDAASSATTLRYYRSSDAMIAASDTELGTDAVVVLAASGSSAESITLTSPSDAGTYYYGACADAVPGETNASNNCSTAVVTTRVQAQRPDLTVMVLASRDSALACLKSPETRIEVAVSNGGTGPARSTTLRYYRSSDAAASSDDEEVGAAEMPVIRPSAAWRHSLEIPSASGAPHYYACIDAAPGETDAGDDCSAIATAAISPFDLVGGMAWSDLGPTWIGGRTAVTVGPGTEFRLVVNFSTEGTLVDMTLRLYRSDDETISIDDSPVATYPPLCGLAAQVRWVTPPSTRGTYYYGGCVDAVQGESDTTNNCTSSLSVTVRGRQ